MKSWVVIAVSALLTSALTVEAQGFPRRDRGGSPREAARGADSRTTTPSASQEPYAALERELPSLKVDLRLSSEQVQAWSVFERDVKDVAEMDRARRKHLMSLRQTGEKAPTAVAMIATLVEEDRLKAEATGDMKRHLDALYGMLDDAQRLMLDKRVVMSQTEPLGR